MINKWLDNLSQNSGTLKIVFIFSPFRGHRPTYVRVELL